MKKVYGYSESDYSRRYSKEERADIRFVALTKSKAEFLRRVQPLSCSSTNWIRERFCETGNAEEIELANKYPDNILVLEGWRNNLIKVI